MNDENLIQFALNNSRRHQRDSDKLFAFDAEDGSVIVATLDELVAEMRDGHPDPDAVELSLRLAVVVLDGGLQQPENPAPGSTAEGQADVVAWVRGAAKYAEAISAKELIAAGKTEPRHV